MILTYFEAGVNPSMSPSKAQLRRCAILGFAHHTHPEALANHLYALPQRKVISVVQTDRQTIQHRQAKRVVLSTGRQYHRSTSTLFVSRPAEPWMAQPRIGSGWPV